MHSLGIVQWNFTRRDHPGNSGKGIGVGSCHLWRGRISGSSIRGNYYIITKVVFIYFYLMLNIIFFKLNTE